MSESYDAIVIGGGPAGSTAGLLLARSGWRVAIIERKPFPRRKVCGEYLSATNLDLLRQMDLCEEFLEHAGPPVTRVGLFAGNTILESELPRPSGQSRDWGRALSREALDTWLLDAARNEGVTVLQPWTTTSLNRTSSGYQCHARSLDDGEEMALHSPVVVAAHGSWEPGPLPTQVRRSVASPGDLFGFKAHFSGSRLPEGLMPLLAFRDGYGGMVHTDGDRISISCCVRRGRLARLARTSGTMGEGVESYMLDACPAIRTVLDGAIREGIWLSAGPIRPGIRSQAPPGIFRVGNAAGEAHPVIAEGISMAMQGAGVLAELLQQWRRAGASTPGLNRAGVAYSRAWRRYFAPRLRASAVVAHWAMSPSAVAISLPVLRQIPQLLNWGARCSGKATVVLKTRNRFNSAHALEHS